MPAIATRLYTPDARTAISNNEHLQKKMIAGDYQFNKLLHWQNIDPLTVTTYVKVITENYSCKRNAYNLTLNV